MMMPRHAHAGCRAHAVGAAQDGACRSAALASGVLVWPAGRTGPVGGHASHAGRPQRAGSFLAAWLYFVLLERTDNRQDRALHWLILIGGFFLLIASRLYIDIRVYGISF